MPHAAPLDLTLVLHRLCHSLHSAVFFVRARAAGKASTLDTWTHPLKNSWRHQTPFLVEQECVLGLLAAPRGLPSGPRCVWLRARLLFTDEHPSAATTCATPPLCSSAREAGVQQLHAQGSALDLLPEKPPGLASLWGVPSPAVPCRLQP